MNFAIAEYTRIQLSAGDLYFLNKRFSELMIEMITSTLTEAHKFMNEHFGERTISSDIQYVSIPNGLGSFATETCVFIDEKTFFSQKNMKGIIHEFIHLGWNAKTDNRTQRIRFFCETFTSYFTLRVVGHLLSHEEYLKEVEGYKSNIRKFI